MMPIDSFSTDGNTLVKGTSTPEQVLLNAGPLRMIYEEGAIRYIRYGETEVLRMVYMAVRDYNWDTVEPVIRKESIENRGDSFSIQTEVEYRNEDLHLVAHFKFTGSATGLVLFEMNGVCRSTFWKNRIGYCILHPIRECAGRECSITEPGGQRITLRFPSAISPHQPFRNMKAMEWELPGKVTATLKLEGDLFETEDQRNWTDASFKTYSTPLDLPFPVQMQAGEEIHQLVELNLRGKPQVVPEISTDQVPLTFNYSDQSNSLPKIGMGRSTEVLQLVREDIERLRKIGFSHYRVDVEFHKAGWQKPLKTACEEAEAMDLPLELALHFPKNSFETEVQEFVLQLLGSKVRVYSLLVLQENSKTTPREFIKAIVPRLRKHFPAAKIGAGTNAYFAELNRQTPPTGEVDFLAYSINPQVHAFDNLSLVETLETQGDTVRNAQWLASGKGIHLSPVTLKPRFNPNATTVPAGQESRESGIDARQQSLFGAGWTLGSIKYLAEAGSESITYYETVGRKGLMLPQGGTPGYVFPMYAVFQAVLEDSSVRILTSKSSHPLLVDGMVLQSSKGLRILLANYTSHPQEVKIPLPEARFQLRLLDEKLLIRQDWVKEFSGQPLIAPMAASLEITLGLPPYGLAFINSEEG